MDYHTKITILLQKYQPHKQLQKEVISSLQQLEKEKVTDLPTYHHLYPGDAKPCIYGLQKIHKESANQQR